MFYKKDVSNLNTNNKVKPDIVSVRNSIITEKDSDNDGVPDWEENLWGTDPFKKETYGNTPDSEYIKSQIEKQNTDQFINTPIFNTDDLSRQVFNEYLLMKKSGTIDANTINKMTDRITNNINTAPLDTPYSVSEVSTLKNPTTKQIQEYSNSLMSVVSKYTSLFRSQADVSNISTSDDDFFNFASVTSGFYLKISQEIMKLEVPNALVDSHLNYANSLKESAQGWKELSQLKTDPIKSMAGISRRTQGEERQGAALAEITVYLRQNGIINFNLPII